MNVPVVLQEVLRPDCPVQEVRPGLWSALSGPGDAALYDARAAAYDRVVGSTLYNRLAWGAAAARYRAFAQRAVTAADGPLLDAGSGSAVFTADVYASAARPIVLVDRSLGMLEAARARLQRALPGGEATGRFVLVQADLFDLPFQEAAFGTVLSMGMLHLFEDRAVLARRLHAFLKPGGRLFMTSLVAERAVGRAYLSALHRAGEVAAPRTYLALRAELEAALGAVAAERDGSMAYLEAQRES